MATYTTNYKLLKPDEDEFYDIEEFIGGNMDIIDSKLNEIEGTETYQITLLAGNWGSTVPFEIQISVPGIKEAKKYLADPILSDVTAEYTMQKKAWNCISKIKIFDDKIRAVCFEKKPLENLVVELRVIK